MWDNYLERSQIRGIELVAMMEKKGEKKCGRKAGSWIQREWKNEQETRGWRGVIKRMNGGREKEEGEEEEIMTLQRQISSKRPTERGFTFREGHQTAYPRPHLCLIKHHPALINTHLHTARTYVCTGTHTALHSAPSLDWKPEEESEKICHLSIHSSTPPVFLSPPSEPFVFHYGKKKQSFDLDVLGRSHTKCFMDQFTSSNRSLSRSMRARTSPPTHMEVRWKADWDFSCANISRRQSFRLLWNQDLSQWMELRTTDFIFHYCFFFFG